MKKQDDKTRDLINGNIPEAIRLADKAEADYRNKHRSLKGFEGWDAVYHRSMDKLCKDLGVRV